MNYKKKWKAIDLMEFLKSLIYFKFCEKNKLFGRCRNGEFLHNVGGKNRLVGLSPSLLLNVLLYSLFMAVQRLFLSFATK